MRVSGSPGIRNQTDFKIAFLRKTPRRHGTRAGDTHRAQTGGIRSQLPFLDPHRDAVEDLTGQEFGGGIAAGEFRQLVEVTKVEITEHGAQAVAELADVRDHAVRVQFGTAQFQIDDVGCAVRALGGTEGLPRKLWAIMK